MGICTTLVQEISACIWIVFNFVTIYFYCGHHPSCSFVQSNCHVVMIMLSMTLI